MLHIDELIRTRRKTIALIIERDGRLIVRAPMRTRQEAIQRFIQQKESWIRRTQERFKARWSAHPPRQYLEGESFLYLGAAQVLHVVDEKKPELCLADGFRLAGKARHIAPLLFKRWYQRQAHHVIPARVEELARQHGYSYARVRISSARTRWGSCSSKGTLSFSWRLVMAPPPVIDYVILHELAHLKIHNHSPKFWSRVAQLVPDYREHKKWLEQNGHLLAIE
jgi:predicted metal-dependent hydrolase